ncbi:hypothetical protein DFH09DRAFT_1357370 [Mycena vulgaris]|nr:hypothetical protein DFH09DRAFT_1357370 [Mycena vulgaris]
MPTGTPPASNLTGFDARKNGLRSSPTLEALASWKNDLLPSSQAVIARAALLDAETELLQINDDIRVPEERRSALLPRLAVYRVAMAPHKKLPADILSHIFTLCAPRPADLYQITCTVCQKDVRLILCQICSHWRSVALDTLKLWSDVDVNFGRTNITRILEVLNVWLSRSRGCPLSLKVTSGKDNDPRPPDLLASYSRQARAMIIRGLRFPHRFFDSPPGSVNLLETLTLVGNELDRQPIGPSGPISIFSDAPLLRCVKLEWFLEHLNPEFMRIPWHQLTELYFENTFPTASQYYSILKDAERMISSRLDVFPPTHSQQIPLSECEIALPALRTLELNTDVLGNAARFLHSIALDSLVDLELSLSDDYDNSIFTVRSFPTLRRLSLMGPGIGSQSDLEAWLRACPAVVDVWIPDYCMQQALVDQLGEGLLPSVQLLTLYAAVPRFIIAALQARQRSREYSTIVEIGLAGVESEQLEANEARQIAKLRMVGVFLSACEGHPRPVSGQITRLARLNAEKGLDPFVRRRFPTEVKS